MKLREVIPEAIVVYGPAPFAIVILDVHRIGRTPGAAQLAVRVAPRPHPPKVSFARHEPRGSAVQMHGVSVLVDQLDAIDAAGTARGAAYLTAVALQLQPGWGQFLDDCRLRLAADRARACRHK